MYNNNIEREITGQAKYSIADMCNTRDKSLPFLHGFEAIKCEGATTRAGRKARHVSVALPGLSAEARDALGRHAEAIPASEPISDMQTTDWRYPSGNSDGRRRTHRDGYDERADDAEDDLTWEARDGDEAPSVRDRKHEAALDQRRKVNATITPAVAAELRERKVSKIPGHDPKPQTMPYAARQFDPWQCEARFLARVFHGEHAQRTAEATATALHSAPEWFTESVFEELVCDGAKPEAVARRLGVTGKTVRKHLELASLGLADYYAKQPDSWKHKNPPTIAFASNATLDNGPTVAYRQAKDDAIINEMLREQAEYLSRAA